MNHASFARAARARGLLVLFVACVAWLGLAGPSPCRAQAPAGVSASPTDSKEYRDLVEEALKEYGLAHYEEARTLFLRAHALQPSARTHRGIGLAEYELRNYAECIVQLEAALASQNRPLTGDVRTKTEDVLSKAMRYVARVFVELTPPHARLLVDRVPVDWTVGQPLVLRVGEHLVEARAEGYVPSSRTLTVLGGSDIRVELALTPVDAPAPVVAAVPVVETTPTPLAAPLEPAPASPGPRHDEPTRRWYKSPWLWTAVGVVVVGAAVGVGVAAARSDDGSAPAYAGSTSVTIPGL